MRQNPVFADRPDFTLAHQLEETKQGKSMEFISDPNGTNMALILSLEEPRSGVDFITKDDMNPQVALMKRPEEEYIDAHVHLDVKRALTGTPEILIISKGRMRADFFTEEKEYVTSREIAAGNILVLFSGGHGFKVLESVEMIEIKQGPYTHGLDKEKFDSRALLPVELLES